MTAVDLPALNSGDELEEPLRFLVPSEVHALADAALRGHYHAIDRALYLTAAFTGLRQGELRGLLWHHIDFDASRVRAFENVVRGERTTPKSRRGRSVPMAKPSPTPCWSCAPSRPGLARTTRSSRTP